MQKALKGVNLGGWLVLEKWMTPSLFSGTTARNHFELAEIPGKAAAIRRHVASFITEDDIRWLHKIGIEAIRVPVGFWAIHGYYHYDSVKFALDWLTATAKKYNIKVLLCLHAAPGAQNNNDHSGSGRPGGVPGWYSRTNQKMTRDILLELVDLYGESIWGIELLNEPHAPTLYHRVRLQQWTRRTLATLAKHSANNLVRVASDGFMPDWWSGKIGNNTLDIHHYQCFSREARELETIDEHVLLLEQSAKKYESIRRNQPVIIGEWSATLPRSLANSVNDRAFCQAQLRHWESCSAWFFWSYKTESASSWNFRHLHKEGYFKGYL